MFCELGNKPHILIVDDNKTLANAICMHIKHDDFKISFASNGIEALNFLQNENVDIVLLDNEMPLNLEIVMTMHIEADISDESFMDRSSGYYMISPDSIEIISNLIATTGVSDEVSSYLVNEVYTKIKEDPWLSETITLRDIEQIAAYISGRISDNNIKTNQLELAKNEAWLHLSSRFSKKNDEELLNKLKTILNITDEPSYSVIIEDNGNVLSCNGIRLNVDPKSNFGKFLKNEYSHAKSQNINLTFGDALENFAREESMDTKDYFLSDVEEKIFCLLARIKKHSKSKTVFLQGLPGGGKTTIAKVFSDVIASKQVEFTLNKEVDTSLFRGNLGLSKLGMQMKVAKFWKELSEDNRSFIFNEADTRLMFLQWMWPHLVGRETRLGTEFPKFDATTKNPFEEIKFGNNQMFIFTGNVRTDIPEILKSQICDSYCMELPETEIIYRTKLLFENWARRNKVKITQDLNKKAENLANLYNTMINEINNDGSSFISERQITPRHLERFSKLFFEAISKGADAEDTFNLLTDIMFCRMWENRMDIENAREIIKPYITARSPPTTEKILDFIKTYNLDIPILFLNNDTVEFEKIRNAVINQKRHSGKEISEQTVNISHSHTKTHLIGGLSRTEEDTTPVNKLGILSSLILQANLSEKQNICWITGYLDLDPQVAPILNEFYQTNWLQTDDIIDEDIIMNVISQVEKHGAYKHLIKAYYDTTKQNLPKNLKDLNTQEKFEFVKFLISHKPINLEMVIVDSADKEIKLHAADIDRFFTINISEEINSAWIKNYINKKLSEILGLNNKLVNQAANASCKAWELFEKQIDAGLYEYNRLGISELNVFIDEIIERAKNKKLDKTYIKLLSLHILGSGLVEDTEVEEDDESVIHDYKTSFLNEIGLNPDDITYSRDFEKRGDKLFFIIDATIQGKKYRIAEQPTRYKDYKKMDEFGRYKMTLKDGKPVDIKLQAPLQSLISQETSVLLFRKYSIPLILEGDPGGGKTTSTEELSKIIGSSHFEEGMYKWIGLAACLGGPVPRGENIVINALDKDADGKRIIDFLRIFEDGGSYVADEGRVSESAGYLLEWEATIAKQQSINLGDYHPGLQGNTGKITKGDGFGLSITQNYHFRTDGRVALGPKIDRSCGKIRVDNIMNQNDAITLINYYLEGQNFSNELKEKLAQLHILLSKKHPQTRMISPRDLIEIISGINLQLKLNISEEQAINDMLTETYMDGMLLLDELNKTKELIKSIFPNFTPSKYSDREILKLGNSNVDIKEVIHWQKSTLAMTKANVLDSMLKGKSREILINQHHGGFGLDIVKLTCALSGRKIDIFEGNPFITARQIFEGDSFVFEDEFDSSGKRNALVKNNEFQFQKTRGRIGKYMLKAGKEKIIPEEEKEETVIVIPNIEEIPASELVKLNRLLTTRKTLMTDENGSLVEYVLPDWIHVVGITNNIDKLSSPFTNRFKKLAIGFDDDVSDMHLVLKDLYPAVTKQETAWMASIAWQGWLMREAEQFELLDNYFTPRNIFDMSYVMQMAKERDSKNGINRNEPLWYVMEAVHYVYLQGLCPEDREIFENEVIINGFLTSIFPEINPATLKAYWNNLNKKIEEQITNIEYRTDSIETDITNINDKPFYFDNGIIVKKEGEIITIITPAKAYSINKNQLLRKYQTLSEGLGVIIKNNKLILAMQLFKNIGGWEVPYDQKNIKLSLPWQEMSAEEFMVPAKALRANMASLILFQKQIKTATEKNLPARIILMPGETGSGKTTICNMLSHAQGIPVVRINPERDMRDSQITVSMSFAGISPQINIKEFFISLGKSRIIKIKDGKKIEGKWNRINAGFPTSNRMRILCDEANITKEIWDLLDASARGENRFNLELADGTIMEVELDGMVEIILTYNPAERYGGTGESGNRFNFPMSLSSKAVRIYVGEPMKVYEHEEIQKIIDELYRRGDGYRERMKKMDGIAPMETKSNFFEVESAIEEAKEIKDMTEPQITSEIRDYIKNGFFHSELEKFETKTKALDDEEKKEMIANITKTFNFNKTQFKTSLDNFEKKFLIDKNTDEKYFQFAKDVLGEYFNGVTLGQIDVNLLNRVKILANNIDPELESILQKFYCAISKSEIKSIAYELDANAKKHKVLLETFTINEWNNRRTFVFTPVKIYETRQFDSELLINLFGKEVFFQVFKDGQIPHVYVLDRNITDNVLGYYDGRDLITVKIDDAQMLNNVICHEFGHIVSDNLSTVNSTLGKNIKERLLKNVELYSTLFPFILSENPQNYINEILNDITNSSRREGDAYKEAALDVLNAFALKLEVSYLKFDLIKQHKIIESIKQLNGEIIKQYASEFFLNPEKYFPNVSRGKYFIKNLNIKINGSIKEISLSKGLNTKPRVETEKMGRNDLNIPDLKEGKELVDDELSPAKKMEIANKKTLPSNVRYWMNKYAKLFAKDRTDSTEVRTVPDGGVAINPQGVLERDPSKMFYAPRYESEDKGVTQNFLIVADTSESITNNETLKNSIEGMIYQYCSMLLELSRKNPDLNIAVATISGRFEKLFDFKDWKKAKTHKARKKLIEKSLSHIWEMTDGGGIAGTEILDAVNEWEFPKVSGKRNYNLIKVLTDGGECGGREKGEKLKEMINDFCSGKYLSPKQLENGKKIKRPKLDMVFCGLNMTGEEIMLPANYPCYLLFPDGVSSDKYLEALFKVAYLQTKKKLKGNLSGNLKSMKTVRDGNLSSPLIKILNEIKSFHSIQTKTLHYRNSEHSIHPNSESLWLDLYTKGLKIPLNVINDLIKNGLLNPIDYKNDVPQLQQTKDADSPSLTENIDNAA